MLFLKVRPQEGSQLVGHADNVNGCVPRNPPSRCVGSVRVLLSAGDGRLEESWRASGSQTSHPIEAANPRARARLQIHVSSPGNGVSFAGPDAHLVVHVVGQWGSVSMPVSSLKL